MISVLRLLGESKFGKAIPALMFAALLASGCDGGIFGTGDSNSEDLLIATTPPGTTDPLGSDEMPPESQGQPGSGDTDVTDRPDSETDDADAQLGEDEDVPPPEAEPGADAMANEPEMTIAFDNTLVGYPGVEPQLRFVNTSSKTILASLGRATGDTEIIEIAPLGVTPQTRLEIGETIIDLTPAGALNPIVRIVASLGLSSVSTVLVQPTDAESSSVIALALETQTTTSDTSLVQLRLVAPAWNFTLSSGLWSLTPSGTNPGSADATLTAIVDASSDPSYTSITAGDYELRLDGQSIELPTLTLNANTVTTLVLSGAIGDLQLTEVFDSDIVGLRVTPD